VVALVLVAGVFFLVAAIDQLMISIGLLAVVAFRSLVVFYGLAGTTLTREVRMVFEAVDRSLDEGRKQVARIVGRDTGKLSAQEVRTAALETLAENLSDGVVAPLFWLAVGGVPAMMAYKMVNTLDSMVGYRTDRYRDFGCVAARLDDVANFIPARLTALLMVTVSGKWGLMAFVRRFGPCHASPNSGYPEAALAGILNCRFGGPHDYFGQLFEKPFIGDNEKMLTTEDMRKAISINRRVEAVTVALTFIVRVLL
jgi:adenosylcobinamide-phosphate synthase